MAGKRAGGFGSTHQMTLLVHSDAIRHLRATGDNEWSVMQILGHMVEMIPYWLGHCRMLIAATAEPPVFGRGPDAPERMAGDLPGACRFC